MNADLTKTWLPPRNIVERVAFMGAFPPCDHEARRRKALQGLCLNITLVGKREKSVYGEGIFYCFSHIEKHLIKEGK